MPTVSVIMPAYRAEQYLEEAVRSVITQTFTDWELIIVNDGSPDGTGGLADRLSLEDKRIRVIHRDIPSGQPAIPRNLALKHARGRFIAFLDSDDVWYSSKLEKQLVAFADTEAPIVFTYYDRMNENGEQLSTVTAPAIVDYRSMLRTCHIGFLTSMIDCEKTGPVLFDENNPFRMQEDYILWLQLLRSGGRAICVPESLAAYRIVTGSVSRNKWKAARAQWYVYRNREGLTVLLSFYYWVQYAFFGYKKNQR